MISPYADPEYKPETYYYTDAIADHAVRFIGEHARDHAAAAVLHVRGLHRRPLADARLAGGHRQVRGKYDGGYEPIRKARFEKAAKLGLIDPKQGLSPAGRRLGRASTDKKWEAACMEVYAAMIDRMDQGIGKIVAELKRTGQFDNTLILFLQDNGGCAENDGPRPANKEHPNILRPGQADASPP